MKEESVDFHTSNLYKEMDKLDTIQKSKNIAMLESIKKLDTKIEKLESDFKEFKGDKHIFSEIWKVYTAERIPWEKEVLERLEKIENLPDQRIMKFIGHLEQRISEIETPLKEDKPTNEEYCRLCGFKIPEHSKFCGENLEKPKDSDLFPSSSNHSTKEDILIDSAHGKAPIPYKPLEFKCFLSDTKVCPVCSKQYKEIERLKSELKRGKEIISTQTELGTKLVAQRNRALEKARVALTEEDIAEIVEILGGKS